MFPRCTATTALFAATAMLAVSLVPAPASAQSNAPTMVQPNGAVCGPRAVLAKQLEKKYAEEAVSMGLASTGAVVEVYASPTGTWTMMLTMPNGVTCILAAGEHWEAVEKKAGFIPSKF